MANANLYFKFVSASTLAGVGGLSPTCNVFSVKRSDGTVSTVASGASCFEVGGGLYGYNLSSPDFTTYDYVATAVPSSATGLANADADSLQGDLSYPSLKPATIGNTLNVSSGIAQADLQTIKTQPVAAAGTVTFPSGTIGTSTLTVGAQMDLVNAPNITAIGAITSGLATAAEVSAVTTHGDTFWLTATGFALSSVWTTTIAGRIDAAVSSRMATYVQPTGFLGVTFPSGTVANTTNITGGTITTTTNLTNAPTSGDFTSAMKSSLNAATPADGPGITKLVSTLVLVSGSTYQFTTQALANAPGGSGSDPWATAVPGSYTAGQAGYILGNVGTVVDTTLSAEHGSGEWGSSSGSGAFAVTVTVGDGTNPVPNANVRLTQGVTSVVATTNGSGVASFSLDAATCALTITKSGYSFAPGSIVVTAAGDFPETITPVVIPSPPSGSPECNIFGFFSGVSSDVPSGKITFTLSHTPSKAGAILCPTSTTGFVANGQLQSANGAAFVPLIRNDSITPDDTTYAISCPAIGLNLTGISLTTPTLDLATLIS